jgi:hypothetical protein
MAIFRAKKENRFHPGGNCKDEFYFAWSRQRMSEALAGYREAA